MLRKFVLTFSFCIVFFCFFASGAKAASLYFSPGSKQLNVGNIVNVRILVDTQGQAINNAEGVISFPSDKLEVVSVSQSGSIFSLWVENPAFSNNDGAITFNGGLPTPGYNGSAGSILNIVFRAKSEGAASVYVSSGSVLANDGLGTDVLQSKGEAQYTLIGSENSLPAVVPSAQAAPASANNGAPAAAQIFSLTNPDQNSWYNNPSPSFNWTLSSGVTAVRLLYDKNPNTQPSVLYSPAITEKSLSGLDDGIYYFHLQQKNSMGWGAVSHFRFQIDTQNPDHFNIKEVPRADLTDPVAKFIFDASDKMSGIDHYVVQIDDGQPQIWQPAADNVYSAPAQLSGRHTLIAKAVDKAGNYLVNTVDFTVEALKPPAITKYPDIINQNNLLAVEGTAEANSNVTVWIKKEKQDPITHNVQSDSSGNFSLIADDNLTVGVYTLWAKVVDSRGAESVSSNVVTLVVTQSALARTGTAVVDFLEVAVPLVSLIILLSLVLWYSWRKFGMLKKKLRRDAGKTEAAMHEVFRTLRGNMEKQIRLLEKTKIKRELTDEEANIIKQIKKDLSGMEEFLTDEIEQIEKDVK